ncbi:MAG: T9SS type A sorting domain-containing protein [Flavobacteriales bacterium]
MKTFLQFAFICLFTAALSSKSQACVDFHPDSVNITILVDTANCNMIIELSNLNMFGGNPNDFCSCGVYNAIPDGADISWVAFVDAVTQEPVEGFDLWEFADEAGDSWSDADPNNIDWGGLVSGVNDAGIVAGQDVNLWIIIEIDEDDPQWSWICNQDEGSVLEFFGSWAFGTDEWDPSAQELADTHQSITYFDDQWANMSVEWITSETYLGYIAILDNFYNGIEEQSNIQVNVFPNPVSEVLSIQSSSVIESICLRDALGRKVDFIEQSAFKIDVSNLPAGLYFVDVTVNGAIETKKVQVRH